MTTNEKPLPFPDKHKLKPSHKILTAFPGFVARAARKAAMLSVVPVHTIQSSEKPAMMYFVKY